MRLTARTIADADSSHYARTPGNAGRGSTVVQVPVPQAQRSERTEVQLGRDDSLIRREPARITEDNQIATNANAENEAAVTHDEADRDSG